MFCNRSKSACSLGAYVLIVLLYLIKLINKHIFKIVIKKHELNYFLDVS